MTVGGKETGRLAAIGKLLPLKDMHPALLVIPNYCPFWQLNLVSTQTYNSAAASWIFQLLSYPKRLLLMIVFFKSKLEDCFGVKCFHIFVFLTSSNKFLLKATTFGSLLLIGWSTII